jgi:Flp pilus assembly protein TadD
LDPLAREEAMRVCSNCHLLLSDSDATCPHDGTATAGAEVPPLPPALTPKFEDLRPFAQGQTGTLQLASQVQGGGRGLLKIIPLDGFEGSERVRLKRELRKQTKLAQDGLPRFLDGGELERELWLFREFIEGESLAQRIRRVGKLGVAEALLVTAQVASALDELQRNGLLHRDVKPGHVILQAGPNGMPISTLIDAGVAARLPSGSVFDLIGTPAYISPEQVAGKLISFRSDLYALGCVMFEMLTGAPPFAGRDVKATLEAHKSAPLPELPPDVELPAQALGLLRALLAKEPRQRPFSAQQVRRTIEPLLPPGAPLPVLHARAPSSAGGITIPPPAAKREPPKARPGARPAPPPVGSRGSPSAAAPGAEELAPEDLVLDELDGSIEERGPSTIQLAPDEFEEIDPNAVHAPSTVNLSPEDLAALEVREQVATHESEAPESEADSSDRDTDQVAAAAVASLAQASEAEAATGGGSAAHDGDAPAAEIAATDTAASGAPSASAAPNRRTVDFDVESLFDDDVPEPPAAGPPTSLQDVAPTQIYRPDAPVVRAAPADDDGQVQPDPEGTVVVARPGSRRPKRPPWMWIAAGAAVLLLLVIVFSSGDDDDGASAALDGEPPRSAASQDGTQGASLAARTTSAPPAEAGGRDQAPSGQAAPAGAEPTPVEHIAAPADPAEQPAAADPAPAAQTGEAIAAEPTEPSADNSGAGGPTLSASAAAAKLGPSAGSKLASSRASRADRVAQAAEFKQQGRTHYQAGRYREAATAYQNATEHDPSDAGAFAGLAASRLAMGDSNAAIAAYSRAVRLQPDSSGFHAALGRAYLAGGDRGRARAAYQKALELNPNNGAAKTALAQLR